MLSVHFKYSRRMHGCVSKNGCKMCRVCSGELCMYTSLKMYRCRFVLTILSGPEEETQVSKSVLSPPPYETPLRRDPAGWMTYDDWADDWFESMLSLWSFLLSSHTWAYTIHAWCFCRHDCVICSHSSWQCFADRHVWKHRHIMEASWHFGEKQPQENICWSPEKNPPPDWVILYGRKTRTSQSHRWHRLVAFITSRA